MSAEGAGDAAIFTVLLLLLVEKKKLAAAAPVQLFVFLSSGRLAALLDTRTATDRK